MTTANISLPDYLLHALLEALRRDLRREEAARATARPGSDDAFRHGLNARFNVEILQLLMPKTPTPSRCRLLGPHATARGAVPHELNGIRELVGD